MSKSRVDRVHINMFELAEELAKEKNIPKVQAYRVLAEAVRQHTKRLKKIEAKNYFKF